MDPNGWEIGRAPVDCEKQNYDKSNHKTMINPNPSVLYIFPIRTFDTDDHYISAIELRIVQSGIFSNEHVSLPKYKPHT